MPLARRTRRVRWAKGQKRMLYSRISPSGTAPGAVLPEERRKAAPPSHHPSAPLRCSQPRPPGAAAYPFPGSASARPPCRAPQGVPRAASWGGPCLSSLPSSPFYSDSALLCNLRPPIARGNGKSKGNAAVGRAKVLQAALTASSSSSGASCSCTALRTKSQTTWEIMIYIIMISTLPSSQRSKLCGNRGLVGTCPCHRHLCQTCQC